MNRYELNKKYKTRARKKANLEFPWYFGGGCYDDRPMDEQLKEALEEHDELINKIARYYENGFPKGWRCGNTHPYKTNLSRKIRTRDKSVLRNTLVDWDEKIYDAHKQTVVWDLS